MIEDLATHQVVKNHHAPGASITLQLFGTDQTWFLDQSIKLIDCYEDLFTVNHDKNEVMDINHTAGLHPVQVSGATYGLIKLAVEKSLENLSSNALISPVVKLRYIGFKGACVLSQSEIDEKMKLINLKRVVLDDEQQTVFLEGKGMELDLGGITKGWIADRIRDQWRSFGMRAGIINLGGNVLFVGSSLKCSSGKWSLGVQDPTEKGGKNITSVMVPECSVVTDEIYERYLKVSGHKYHHLIDPRTGYPVETNLAGVTIFTKNSADAEIECKRLLFVGKPVDGWLNDNRIGTVFVYQNEEVTYEGFDGKQKEVALLLLFLSGCFSNIR